MNVCLSFSDLGVSGFCYQESELVRKEGGNPKPSTIEVLSKNKLSWKQGPRETVLVVEEKGLGPRNDMSVRFLRGG